MSEDENFDDEMDFSDTPDENSELPQDGGIESGSIISENLPESGNENPDEEVPDPYADDFEEKLPSFVSKDGSQNPNEEEMPEPDGESTNEEASEDEEEDFSETSRTPPNDGVNEDDEDDDEDDAENDSEPPKKLNFADKINRKNLWIILCGAVALFFILMIFLPSVFPKDKKKKQGENQSSSASVPNFLENWEEKKVLQEKNVYQEDEPRQEISGDDLEKKLDFMITEQEQTENPPPPPQATGGGDAAVSTRPVTNRNEQQTSTLRMKIDDNASLGNLFGGQNQSGYQNYGQNPYMQNYNAQVSERNAMLSQTLQNLQNQNGQNDGISASQKNKQNFYKEGQTESGNFKFNSPVSLWSGTIIPAVLVTAINTDLPGVVIARVSKNVYSSQNGNFLLIPEGTQLFATYNSSVSYGQNRVQIAWNKMIRPDGLEMDLGNLNGTDTRGRSGNAGFVNEHPFEVAKALGIIAVFSILNTKFEIQPTNNLYAQNAMADVYGRVRDMEADIVDRALDIQPTITIPSGTVVNLITNTTLEIPPLQDYNYRQKYVRTK